jgi:uncharacterized integral membrane protein (TIGR00698 family)
MQKELKGILLSVAIGALAIPLAAVFGSSNIILAGLILGIVVGNLVKLPEAFDSGISFTGSKLLEISIVFLAFSINFNQIAAIGSMNFILLAIGILLLLFLTIYLSKKLDCPSSAGWLIGFGTAICGSSAIAALSTSIKKEKEDVGMAMAVVNLLGSVGMLALPFAFQYLNLSNEQMGFLIGGSLHSVGNVAGAGYSISKEVGDTAITIKLARVALLTPYLILFKFMLNRESIGNWREHFKLPWYLILFIIITIVSSFVSIPETVVSIAEQTGKYILTVAMAAIGLKVSFKKLISIGKKGIIFGLVLFAMLLIIISAAIIIN